MGLGLRYKNEEQIFQEQYTEPPYLEYPMFRETGIVKHGFSTRIGGVSKGCFSSLNLSFTRGDEEEAVRENFRRIGSAMGIRCEDMVFTHQTHTINVRVVTEADRGCGIVKPRTYSDVDGLVTDIPGICLVTFYADCVPLYFVDPVKKVIGLSHSGWRGTVGKIGKVTVETMCREFKSRPEDILAAVGPSICQDCSIGYFMCRHILLSASVQSFLLFCIHCFQRTARTFCSPVFHFTEYQILPVPGNQIDLPCPTPVVILQDLKSLLF